MGGKSDRSLSGVVSAVVSRLPGRQSGEVIGVIRLEGVIGAGMGARSRGGLTAEGVDPILKQVFEDKQVTAVALVINSPGGAPGQSELIGRRIRQLAQKHTKKVLVFCEDVAASGGYWLACAGDEIFALDTSIVGSIGVVMASFGLEDFIAEHHIHRRVVTAGEDKHRLDPFIAPTEDDEQWLRRLQGDIHTAFKDWVSERRGQALKGTSVDLFTGDVWVGRRAQELGLVDGIATLAEIVTQRYPDAKVREYAQKKPLLARLTASSASELTGAMVDNGLSALKQRALWAQFGQ